MTIKEGVTKAWNEEMKKKRKMREGRGTNDQYRGKKARKEQMKGKK